MFECGFFNSVNGDRKYNSEQISALFDGLITDGVLAHCGQKFSVSAGTGMNVVVGSGRCWFSHVWGLSDGNNIVSLDPADSTRPRIDTIVVEVDKRPEIRNAFIKAIKGTPAASATKPTLTKNDNIVQWPLAHVTIPANASAISASNIQNVVGTSECPFVTSILTTVSIDSLLSQWEGEFNTWFNNVKSQMSGNVVTNLQNQIDTNKNNITSLNSSVQTLNQNLTTANTTVNDLKDSIYIYGKKYKPYAYTGGQVYGKITSGYPTFIHKYVVSNLDRIMGLRIDDTNGTINAFLITPSGYSALSKTIGSSYTVNISRVDKITNSIYGVTVTYGSSVYVIIFNFNSNTTQSYGPYNSSTYYIKGILHYASNSLIVITHSGVILKLSGSAIIQVSSISLQSDSKIDIIIGGKVAYVNPSGYFGIASISDTGNIISNNTYNVSDSQVSNGTPYIVYADDNYIWVRSSHSSYSYFVIYDINANSFSKSVSLGAGPANYVGTLPNGYIAIMVNGNNLKILNKNGTLVVVKNANSIANAYPDSYPIIGFYLRDIPWDKYIKANGYHNQNVAAFIKIASDYTCTQLYNVEALNMDDILKIRPSTLNAGVVITPYGYVVASSPNIPSAVISPISSYSSYTKMDHNLDTVVYNAQFLVPYDYS